MESLLDFARGPLFRLTFALMAFGLIRIFLLDIIGAVEAYRRAGDKDIPWKAAASKTITWLFPVKRALNVRPIYSLCAFIFHVGMILVPLFLFAHVELWRGVLGFGWFTLPKSAADILTLVTIAAGIAIFLGRIGSRAARAISRKQDYIWPIVIIIPFVTGYFCANIKLPAAGYQTLMLTHVLSAELIFMLLPFTKLAHCVIQPLSQFIITLAWKFPPNTDDEVATALKKKGAPV